METAALGLAEARRGRLLDELLVPPLGRAVALAERHDVPGRVAEELDLDVAGRQRSRAPGRPTRRRRRSAASRDPARSAPTRSSAAIDAAHPPPPAAGRGLDQEREAHIAGRGQRPPPRCSGLSTRAGSRVPGTIGHVRFACDPPRRELVAERRDGRGRRADEGEAGVLHRLGERLSLRQEAVAGVDGLGAQVEGGGHERIDPQVALRGRRRPEPHGVVGGPDVGRRRHPRRE